MKEEENIDSMEDLEELFSQQVYQMLVEGEPLARLKGISDQELEEKYVLAYGYCEQGCFDLAMPYFTYLVTMQPYDRRFHLGVALCMQREGMYEQAAKSYVVALFMDPSDPVPSFCIAECLIQLNMLADARDALQTSIEQSYGDVRYVSIRERAQALLVTLS